MIEDFPVLVEVLKALSSDEEREFMLDAFGSRAFSAEVLASELRRRGFRVSASTIRTYRREKERNAEH